MRTLNWFCTRDPVLYVILSLWKNHLIGWKIRVLWSLRMFRGGTQDPVWYGVYLWYLYIMHELSFWYIYHAWARTDTKIVILSLWETYAHEKNVENYHPPANVFPAWARIYEKIWEESEFYIYSYEKNMNTNFGCDADCDPAFSNISATLMRFHHLCLCWCLNILRRFFLRTVSVWIPSNHFWVEREIFLARPGTYYSSRFPDGPETLKNGDTFCGDKLCRSHVSLGSLSGTSYDFFWRSFGDKFCGDISSAGPKFLYMSWHCPLTRTDYYGRLKKEHIVDENVSSFMTENCVVLHGIKMIIVLQVTMVVQVFSS